MKTYLKAFITIVLMSLLIISATGCDLFDSSADTYRAEVEINGVESPEHYDVFTVMVDNGESRTITWEEGDVDNNTLKDTISNLEGEVTLELGIDDEDIDGSYTVEYNGEEIIVDRDNNRAKFEVEFEPEQVRLTVENWKQDGIEQLTVNEKTADQEPYEKTFDHGTEVELEAILAEGYEFVKWDTSEENRVDPIDEPATTVTMDQDVTVAPQLELEEHIVSLATLEGEGAVDVDIGDTGEVDEILESEDEIFTVDHGTEVTFESDAAEGYEFNEWLGDASGESDPFTQTIEDDFELGLEFELKQHTLTVENWDIEGIEGILVDGEDIADDPHTEEFDHSTEVEIEAILGEGYEFVEWSAEDTDNIDEIYDSSIKVSINQDINISPVVEIKEHKIELKTLEEKGAVKASWNGDDTLLSSTGESFEVEHDTEVTFAAEADEGFEFASWLADAENVEESEFTTNITADYNLGIKFEYIPQITDVEIEEGPDTVYAASEKDTTEEYEYSAVILDQRDNIMDDEEVGWELEDSPSGVSIDDEGILQVDWDASTGEFQVKAYAQEEHEVYDEISVTLKHLSEDKEHIYEDALSSLDDEMEEYDLESVEDDFDLPDKITGYDQEGEEYEFDVLWSAEEHEAITIENDNEAKVTRQAEDITGYITAFIQPIEGEILEQEDDDPRQESYEVTVPGKDLEDAELNVEFELKHSFPAAKVDDYYDIDTRTVQTMSDRKKYEPLQVPDDKEVPDEIIVGLHSAGALQNTEASLRERNYTVVDRNSVLNALLVRPPVHKSSGQAMRDLESLSSVRYVERNKYLYALSTNHPEAELYREEQWHYPQIRLPQTWNESTGGNNVRVAILDTGIDAEHPDLEEFVDVEAGHNFGVYEEDMETGDEEPEETPDINGHGTHVAGTVIASSDGGTAGTMWSGELIPVKVLDNDEDQASGTFWAIASGIQYAAGYEVEVNDGEEVSLSSGEAADIINLSLGGSFTSNSISDAISKARQKDVIIMGAAGNAGIEGHIAYPASHPEVISVGSTNYNYPNEPGRAGHSNISEELDVMAPGGSLSDEDYVWSTHTTHPDNEHSDHKYVGMIGTSMAAPHASGVAGLMLSEGIRPRDVREILKSTSMDLSTIDYEAGLINSYWAINEVDSFNAELYRDTDNDMEKVDSKSVSLDENEAEFEIARAGDYEVKVWVDVQDTGSKDPSDYVGTYGPFEVDLGEEYDAELNVQEYVN